MLRLSRFRGRRGVLGRLDWWNGSACSALDDERCGWSDDLGAGALLPQRREMSGVALEGGWQSRDEKWGMSRGGLHFGCSRVQSRSYADGPFDQDEGAGVDDESDGRDEREVLLDLIEKDMSIQDDVAMYLYSKVREMDPKTLLGAMYIKAGFQPPRYSVKAGFKEKFIGTVVAKGRTFRSSPCSSEEDAEKGAADSALSWILGQPAASGAATGATGERGRGRGRGRGMMDGGRRRGRGRGPNRGGGNAKKRGMAQCVPLKPRKSFHVEINYKTLSFVVLYNHPQMVYYPFHDFPNRRDLDAMMRRPGF